MHVLGRDRRTTIHLHPMRPVLPCGCLYQRGWKRSFSRRRALSRIYPSLPSTYLAELGIEEPDATRNGGLIWMHALAIGYSPAYLIENADGIRRDWPASPCRPIVRPWKHRRRWASKSRPYWTRKLMCPA